MITRFWILCSALCINTVLLHPHIPEISWCRGLNISLGFSPVDDVISGGAYTVEWIKDNDTIAHLISKDHDSMIDIHISPDYQDRIELLENGSLYFLPVTEADEGVYKRIIRNGGTFEDKLKLIVMLPVFTCELNANGIGIMYSSSCAGSEERKNITIISDEHKHIVKVSTRIINEPKENCTTDIKYSTVYKTSPPQSENPASENGAHMAGGAVIGLIVGGGVVGIMVFLFMRNRNNCICCNEGQHQKTSKEEHLQLTSGHEGKPKDDLQLQ